MKKIIIDILIRSIKTFAEVFVSLLTVGIPLNQVDWKYILSVSATSFIYTIFFNISKLKSGDKNE